ncbi:hypothetical protein SSCG_00958 [Streptomyces clavuligerus]|nr:hypothetical protein SSCG_00958 [Streptomyces clavuligerus]
MWLKETAAGMRWDAGKRRTRWRRMRRGGRV